MHHWPRNDKGVHMWSMPNKDGSLNVGLYMKIEIFEHYRKDFTEF